LNCNFINNKSSNKVVVLKEANLVKEKANEHNVFTQTAFMYRFMPGLIAVRDMIQNGDIGEVINFRIEVLHSSYLNEDRPISWKLKKETSGGGPLLDLGIHMADLVRFIFGDVSAVKAHMDTVIKQRYGNDSNANYQDVDVEDWSVVELFLPKNIYGNLTVSRVASLIEDRMTIEIFGMKGSLKFNINRPGNVRFYSHNKGILKDLYYPILSEYGEYISEIYPSTKTSMGWLIDAHFTSIYNFYHNLSSGEVVYSETPVFEEAVKAQAIIEACYLSAKNNSEKTLVEHH